MLPLSGKQVKVLQAIEAFARREGRMPSVRELAARLRRSAPTVQQHLAALEHKGMLARDGTAHGLRLLASAPGEKGTRPPPGATRVPVVGRIAAGAPIDALENPLDEVLVPGAPPGAYGLQVRGDSMIDDHILDGDLVIVRPAETVPDGAVAVCLLAEGACTLKRVYRERAHGRVRLQAANPAVAPIYTKTLRIQGQVYAIWRVV